MAHQLHEKYAVRQLNPEHGNEINIFTRMKRRVILIIGAIIFALLIVIGWQQYMLFQTKQYSPEATVQYVTSDIRVDVFYNRPYKKGRNIFGELVPFGEWWRTGANEATTITFSRDVAFNENDILKAGKYSVVTIPNTEEWVLIFSNKVPDWGTDYDDSADALRTLMAVEQLPEVVEQFTIDITEDNHQPQLIMAWDKTKVSVPFRVL